MKNLFHIEASELSDLGVVDWGYTDQTQPTSFATFEKWLPENGAALPFLAVSKNVKYRSNLNEWWPKAQSAIVFHFSYAPAKKALLDEKLYQVAGYSLGFEGRDYHEWMKDRLHTIAARLKTKIDFEFRHSHDTEAILERDLSFRAGLGWVGKNSMLISRQHGSYFLIGALILDRKIDLTLNSLSLDHCGTCRACIDACPTKAIDLESRTIKAKDCISTWTIEDRSAETPAPMGMETARGEIFGCDICQDVCPWNQKLLPSVTAFLSGPAKNWVKWFKRDLEVIAFEVSQLTNRGYLRLMKNTVYSRPGRLSFLRTIAFWMRQKKN
ncbi:MAG: DUF1730 domain-containing protein [Bacteriovoracaceae bacterium]|nr:DUF1730 domain-containing protein [Bacteriovoracaceae bacterium]